MKKFIYCLLLINVQYYSTIIIFNLLFAIVSSLNVFLFNRDKRFIQNIIQLISRYFFRSFYYIIEKSRFII